MAREFLFVMDDKLEAFFEEVGKKTGRDNFGQVIRDALDVYKSVIRLEEDHFPALKTLKAFLSGTLPLGHPLVREILAKASKRRGGVPASKVIPKIRQALREAEARLKTAERTGKKKIESIS